MLDKLEVADPKAAAPFSAARSRGLIFALIQSDRSLRDLADLSGMSLSLLHYHVRKFVRLGLAQVVGSRARAGRPVLLYRATAASFSVDSSLVQSTAGANLRVELQALLDRANLAVDPGATLYLLDDNGNPTMQRVPGANGAKPAGERWWRLALGDRDARELVDQIGDLVSSYAEREKGARPKYLCHFALARS